uniref:Uncharacterized protein n=1 Tax=Leersia perrieri TaxID=77586 RepID=A0A0D9XV41_9ORYZ
MAVSHRLEEEPSCRPAITNRCTTLFSWQDITSSCASRSVSSSPTNGRRISGRHITSGSCRCGSSSAIMNTRRASCSHSFLFCLAVTAACMMMEMRLPTSAPTSCATVAACPSPPHSAMARPELTWILFLLLANKWIDKGEGGGCLQRLEKSLLFAFKPSPARVLRWDPMDDEAAAWARSPPALVDPVVYLEVDDGTVAPFGLFESSPGPSAQPSCSQHPVSCGKLSRMALLVSGLSDPAQFSFSPARSSTA